MMNQTENLLKLIERHAATIERLEVQLADGCRDAERLDIELAAQALEILAAERTNRELRERIATLERVPSMATSVSWSRVRDYTGEA
tara:strand:+ start:1495 stop:1755 length:261 start_codon:yes stop_codon:yes gene_type:complete